MIQRCGCHRVRSQRTSSATWTNADDRDPVNDGPGHRRALAGATEPATRSGYPTGRERLGALGAEIIGGTPKEFADHIQRGIPKWAKVIKDAGVKLK